MAIIQNLEAFVQSYPAGLDSVTDLQLSQNENGRQIRFTIGGVTIPAGSVATISGTKPDGVVYSNTGTIEGSDTVIFDEDVQMTAVFGTWYAKIRITNAGNTIASARVRFIIDKDPVDAGAIPSESQLDGLVAEAEEYAETAEGAAERAAINYGSPLTASTAAAMTDINRVYVYTGSESGYTYGNWYYYNGSAWVSGGVYNSAAVETDTTLTESGVPADAKATGDKIAELKDDLYKTTKTYEVAAIVNSGSAKTIDILYTSLPFDISDGTPVKVNIAVSGACHLYIYNTKADNTQETLIPDATASLYFETIIKQSAYKGWRIYVHTVTANSTINITFTTSDSLPIVDEGLRTNGFAQLNAKARYKFIAYGMDSSGMAVRVPDRIVTLGWCYTPDALTIIGNGKIKVSVVTADDIHGTNPVDHSWVTNAYGQLSYTIPADTFFRMQLADINGVENSSNIITDVASSHIYQDLILISASAQNNAVYPVMDIVRQNNVCMKGIHSVAHQGYIPGQYTGHSTLEAIKGAFRAGFDEIETDIKFSSDGVPVMAHDFTFTDTNTSTVITIADHTVAELKTYGYFGGTIATLDEFLNLAKCLGFTVWLDQVALADTEEKWETIFDTVTKYQMQDRIIWVTMTEAVVNRIVAFYSKSRFNFTGSNDFWMEYAISQAVLHTEIEEIIVTLNYDEFTVAEAQTIQEQLPVNAKLGAYTINDTSNYKAYLPYVVAIVSDAYSYPMIVDSYL